jgi:hypothetical protein
MEDRYKHLALVEAAVRDTGREFDHGLTGMGCRRAAEKSYFLCRQRGAGGDRVEEVLLTLVNPQGRNLMAEQVAPMREFLDGIRHPFVMPTLGVILTPQGGAGSPKSFGFFRSVAERGSLKDLLFDADAALPASEKYRSDSRSGIPIPFDQMTVMGRQILEGAVTLQSLGVSCAALHIGNILLLAEDWVVLTDWENDVLGLKSLQRKHDVYGSRPNPAVYAFGHVIYAMATGGGTLASSANLPKDIGQKLGIPIATLLDTIFNQAIGDSYEPIGVTDLLALPFFATAPLRDRHRRLLSMAPATAKQLRTLLQQSGDISLLGSDRKREIRGARRYLQMRDRETKAIVREEKGNRKYERNAKRQLKELAASDKAARRAKREALERLQARKERLLHLVELDSALPVRCTHTSPII